MSNTIRDLPTSALLAIASGALLPALQPKNSHDIEAVMDAHATQSRLSIEFIAALSERQTAPVPKPEAR